SGKASATWFGAKGVSVARVIVEAAVEINVANPNHFVAGIREEWIVVKIVDSLDKASVAGSGVEPGKVAIALVLSGARLERRQHVMPILGSATDCRVANRSVNKVYVVIEGRERAVWVPDGHLG